MAISPPFLEKIFPGKEPGEQVLMYVRRHWIVLVRIIIRTMMFALVPIVALFIVVNTLIVNIETGSTAYILLVLGLSLYYLFVALFFYHDWLDYHLDLWIVTNLRIINIEQKRLFSRTVAQQDIERVQDITCDIHGKLPTLLDFGNVTIQTAGEKIQFVFEQVAHPQEVAKEIMRIHREVATTRRQEGSTN